MGLHCTVVEQFFSPFFTYNKKKRKRKSHLYFLRFSNFVLLQNLEMQNKYHKTLLTLTFILDFP